MAATDKALQKNREYNNKDLNSQKIPFYNWSDITYKEIFHHIFKNYAPNLYYFCWVGYNRIEGKKIGLPFKGLRRKYSAAQTCLDLSNMKLGNKVISLLIPFPRGERLHTHNITFNDIKISKIGIKVWKKSKEEGVWDDLLSIPRKFYLSVHEYIDYCNEYILFDYQLYLKRISKLDININNIDYAKNEEINKSKRIVVKAQVKDLDAVSSKNIEQNIYQQNLNCNLQIRKRKKRSYNSSVTRIAINLPIVTARGIFQFAYKSKDWFPQNQLDNYLIENSEFEQNLATLDKKSQSYNRRRFITSFGSLTIIHNL